MFTTEHYPQVVFLSLPVLMELARVRSHENRKHLSQKKYKLTGNLGDSKLNTRLDIPLFYPRERTPHPVGRTLFTVNFFLIKII